MKKKIFSMLVLLMTAVTGAWADEVTFSASDLKATLPSGNANIAVPYEWKESSDQVTVTIAKQDGTEATLAVGNTINLTNAYQFTVSVRGAGTLNSIKLTTNPTSQAANVTVNNGTYTSPNWTPEGETNSVTFTVTNTFRLTQIAVDYTPDPTPSEPEAPAVTPTENKNEWTFTMPGYAVVANVEYDTELALNEVDDNAAILDEWDGYEANITLTRSLTAGMWNTLTLPFGFSAQNLAALKLLITAQGGTIAVKQLASSSLNGESLTLIFEDANEIEAGKPYLVKVSKAIDFSTLPAQIDALSAPVNPFKDVEISKEAVPVETQYVNFIPTLGKTLITGPEGNASSTEAVLYLAANNKLVNPTVVNDTEQQSSYLKGFRAYFQLKDASKARSFSLNLGEEITGIIAIDHSPSNLDNSVYDLQGRRVDGQRSTVNGESLKKGVYIVNGKKQIIK